MAVMRDDYGFYDKIIDVQEESISDKKTILENLREIKSLNEQVNNLEHRNKYLEKKINKLTKKKVFNF